MRVREVFARRRVRVACAVAGGPPRRAPKPPRRQGTMMAMPVPVSKVVKQNAADLSRLSRRGSKSIRSISLQARVPGYIEAQPAADGADVKDGDLLYKIDPRDLRRRSIRRRRRSQRDAASLEYARANFSRGSELVKSGFVAKDAYDQRESTMRAGRSRARCGSGGDGAGDAQPQLCGNPRAVRRPARAQPRRRRARSSARDRRPRTRSSSSIPIYVTFNPSESRARRRSSRRAPPARSRRRCPRPASDKPRARASCRSSTTPIDRSTGTIVARVRSRTTISRCCRANTFACGCLSATSPTR